MLRPHAISNSRPRDKLRHGSSWSSLRRSSPMVRSQRCAGAPRPWAPICPLFLAVETPPEVRFEGKNFIPIVKGQRPRFGLVGDGRDLAAVVPLHRFARNSPGSGRSGSSRIAQETFNSAGRW